MDGLLGTFRVIGHGLFPFWGEGKEGSRLQALMVIRKVGQIEVLYDN